MKRVLTYRCPLGSAVEIVGEVAGWLSESVPTGSRWQEEAIQGSATTSA